MTETELELLRLQMQVIARDVLVEWLVRRTAIAEGLLSTWLPLPPSIAATDLRKLHQEFQALAFPEATPVESDLRAAEAQEAFETALRQVLDLFRALGVELPQE